MLESSLQRSGQTIRINSYLVNSKTHRQIAARSITVDANDVFGMQDRHRARPACYIARQAGNRDRVLTMKTMLWVTVLVLGALGSSSGFAQNQMAYGDAATGRC